MPVSAGCVKEPEIPFLVFGLMGICCPPEITWSFRRPGKIVPWSQQKKTVSETKNSSFYNTMPFLFQSKESFLSKNSRKIPNYRHNPILYFSNTAPVYGSNISNFPLDFGSVFGWKKLGYHLWKDLQFYNGCGKYKIPYFSTPLPTPNALLFTGVCVVRSCSFIR